ncbi:hypothetical protein [Chryseobacterium sp. R2ACT005]|uniref:hypothetical protein n=1 Tax=Chryseobacterium sp. R2ACT005 TaxID=3416668 RepID=UPI003CE86B35
MEILQEFSIWTKGDELQGKIMVGIGLVLVLCLLLGFKYENPLLKGMFIPICLLTAASLGYGSFITYSRTKHLKTLTEQYGNNPKETVKMALGKAQNDHKIYIILKIVWSTLLILSVLIFLFTVKEYYKGLILGLFCLFVGFLLIETFLHSRLTHCFENVSRLDKLSIF